MANFSTGLQMGMGLARDVRSANMAAAERRERSKYRKSAEARAVSREEREVSGEQRAVSESGARLKSLKKGMKRAKSAEGRAVSREEREVSAEGRAKSLSGIQLQILQQKQQDSQNPIITALDHNAGALEKYSKMQQAADARHADRMGPLNAAIGVAEKTNSPDLPNLLEMRETELLKHRDFKHGLEQSFMAASNRPYEGKWSIRPYFNEFRNTMSYGATLEGASGSEVKAAMESIKSMGGTVGISAGASAATPARPVDPNDPGGIRPQTRAAP
jgi:hypothetical protein